MHALINIPLLLGNFVGAVIWVVPELVSAPIWLKIIFTIVIVAKWAQYFFVGRGSDIPAAVSTCTILILDISMAIIAGFLCDWMLLGILLIAILPSQIRITFFSLQNCHN